MPISYAGVNNGNGWEDWPSTNTPRNKDNFNIGENGIKAITVFANALEAQVNQIVKTGDSSVEAAQARVKADGTTYTTLRERLNAGDTEAAKKATYYDLDSQSGIVLNFNKTEDAVIEISKIEGGAYQKVTSLGKNLMPPLYYHNTIKTNGTTQGITFTMNSDGTFNAVGTVSSSGITVMFSNMISILQPGTMYYLSGSGTNLPIAVEVTHSDTTKAWYSAATAGVAFSFIATDTSVIVYLQQNTSGTVINTTVKPFICLNSLTDKTWAAFVPNSPSPDYPATINTSNNFNMIARGKNLFMANTLTAADDGVTVTKNSDGSYTLNGTSVSGGGIFTAGNTFNGTSIISVLKAGTYVLKGTGSSDVGVFIYLTSLSTQQKNAYVNDATIVFNDDMALLSFSIRWYAGVTFNNKKIYPQLELGSTVTSFEPYKSNQLTIPYELVKLSSTVYDGIEKVDGVLKLIKRVGKVVLNGSETWIANATQTSGLYRRLYNGVTSLISKPSDNSIVANLICNRYVTKSATNTYQNTVGVSVSLTGDILIYDSNYNTSDVSTFKTWLASNNVIVYYALATPVETTLDNLYLTSYPGISSVYTTAITSTNITGNAKSQLWNDMRIIKKQLTDLTNAVTLLGGQ